MGAGGSLEVSIDSGNLDSLAIGQAKLKGLQVAVTDLSILGS
jgi:hypothetical protein